MDDPDNIIELTDLTQYQFHHGPNGRNVLIELNGEKLAILEVVEDFDKAWHVWGRQSDHIESVIKRCHFPIHVHLEPPKKKKKKEEKPKEPEGPRTVKQEYEHRLKEIFEKHNPDKLEGLQDLLKKYKNKEHTIYKKVCSKYKVRPKPLYKEPPKKRKKTVPKRSPANKKKKLSKEEKLQAEVKQLNEQKEQLQRTIDSLSDEQMESAPTGNFDSERATLLDDFEREKEILEEQAQDETAARLAELEASLLEDFIREKEDLIKQTENEVKTVYKMMEKEKDDLANKWDEERNSILNMVDDEIESLKSENERLKKMHAEEKIKFMDTFEDQVASIIADTAAAAISENFKVERKTLEDKHAAEVEEMRAKLKAQYAKDYKKKKRKYEDQIVEIFQEEKKQLEESLALKKEHEIKEIELHHKQALKKVKAEKKKLEGEKRRLANRVKTMKEQSFQMEDSLQDQHAAQFKKWFDSEKAKMQKNFEKSKEELEKKIREEYAGQEEKIRAEYKGIETELWDKHQAELSKVRGDFEEEIASMEEEFEREKHELVLTYKQRIEEVQAEFDIEKDEIIDAQTQQQVQEMKTATEGFMLSAMGDFDAERAQLEEEFEYRMLEMKAILEQEYKLQMVSKDAKKQKEMQKLSIAFAKEKESLRAEFAKEKRQIQEEFRSQKQEMLESFENERKVMEDDFDIITKKDLEPEIDENDLRKKIRKEVRKELEDEYQSELAREIEVAKEDAARRLEEDRYEMENHFELQKEVDLELLRSENQADKDRLELLEKKTKEQEKQLRSFKQKKTLGEQFETQVNSLQKTIQKLQATNDELQKESSEKSKQVDSLQRQIRTLKMKPKPRQMFILKSGKTPNSSEERYLGTIQKYEEIINNIWLSNEDKEQQLAILLKRLHHMGKQENRRIDQDITDDRLADLQIQIRENEGQMQEYENNEKHMNKVIRDHERTIKDLREKLKVVPKLKTQKLRKKLNDLKNNYRLALKSKDKYKKAVVFLKGRLHQCEDDIDQKTHVLEMRDVQLRDADATIKYITTRALEAEGEESSSESES